MIKKLQILVSAVSIFAMVLFGPAAALAEDESTSVSPTAEQTDAPTADPAPSSNFDKQTATMPPAPTETPTEITQTQQNESASTAETAQMVAADENINAEDLGVKEARLLPNSKLYFAKKIWRNAQKLITLNPVKEANLNIKFANEKLIETKQLAEKTQKPEILESALDNYKEEIKAVYDKIQDISKNAEQDKKVEILLEKIIDSNIKQQKLIDHLEKKMPDQVFEKIREIKEDAIDKFANSAARIAPPEILKERIENVLDRQNGSEFKNFKNLEILKAIGDKVPEEAKDAIRQAQDNVFKRFQGDMEQAPAQMRERFSDYAKNIGGDQARQLEILHTFQTKETMPDPIRAMMDQAKEITIERISQQMRNFDNLDSPQAQQRQMMMFKRFEDGNMKNVRIVKELENNLPPDVVNKIIGVKNKTMASFADRIREADTPEQQAQFFNQLQDFHDVRQLEMFKEMDKLIPDNKKEFWGQMKGKAKEEMQNEVNQAKNEQEKMMIFGKLAGNDPSHIQVIKEFAPSPEIMQGILREQVAKLNAKIETAEDAQRLEVLKSRIQEEDDIRAEVEKRNPDMFKKLEARQQEIFAKGFDSVAINNQIKQLEGQIQESENALQNADQAMIGMTPANMFLQSSKERLEKARAAVEQGKIGEAFGMITSGLQQATGVLRISKEMEVRKEVMQKNFEAQFKNPILQEQNGAFEFPPPGDTEQTPPGGQNGYPRFSEQNIPFDGQNFNFEKMMKEKLSRQLEQENKDFIPKLQEKLRKDENRIMQDSSKIQQFMQIGEQVRKEMRQQQGTPPQNMPQFNNQMPATDGFKPENYQQAPSNSYRSSPDYQKPTTENFTPPTNFIPPINKEIYNPPTETFKAPESFKPQPPSDESYRPPANNFTPPDNFVPPTNLAPPANFTPPSSESTSPQPPSSLKLKSKNTLSSIAFNFIIWLLK